MSRADRRADRRSVQAAQAADAAVRRTLGRLAIVAVAVLMVAGSVLTVAPAARPADPIVSTPDVPSGLVAEVMAHQIQLAPLSGEQRDALRGKSADLARVAADAARGLGTTQSASVSLAALSAIQTGPDGKPIPGGQTYTNKPVYVFYYQGLQGLKINDQPFSRFVLFVDATTGEKLVATGL